MNKITLTLNFSKDGTSLQFVPTSETDMFLAFYNININGEKTNYELILEHSGEDKWISLWDGLNKTIKNYDNTNQLTSEIAEDVFNTIIK
jgi:hypothetical protein